MFHAARCHQTSRTNNSINIIATDEHHAARDLDVVKKDLFLNVSHSNMSRRIRYKGEGIGNKQDHSDSMTRSIIGTYDTSPDIIKTSERRARCNMMQDGS